MYIDPGTFGVISQVGYLILFVIVTGGMFFINPVKKGLRWLFKKRQPPVASQDTPPSSPSADKRD